MLAYVVALLLGVVAGLRGMMAPAAVSWAARLGVLPLQSTRLAFLGFSFTPYVFSLLAIAELVTDQLPQTLSRKVPMQFGARIVSGAFCGTAVTLPSGGWIAGLALGAIGTVIGTLDGAAARVALARSFGTDRPAALIEDVVAIGGSALLMGVL